MTLRSPEPVRSALLTVIAGGLVLGTGCDSRRGVADALRLERDSAGVYIIENQRPVWASAGGWIVDEGPLLSIGGAAAEGPYVLFGITDALVLTDGSIAASLSGSADVRVFSAAGQHLRTVGRSGVGPGEFTTPVYLDDHGGSLRVYDSLARRLSVFDDGYQFRESSQFELMPGYRPAGRFHDGSLAIRGTLPGSGALSSGSSVTARETHVFLRVGENGELLDSLAVLDGPLLTMSMQGNRMSMMREAFPIVPQIAAHDLYYVLAGGASYELHIIPVDGGQKRIVRRNVDRVRIEAEHQEGASAEATGPARFFAAYGPIHLDTEGNLWVEGFRPPRVSDPPTADVYNNEGHWLGTVTLPDGLRIMRIGADYVLGVRRDEFDVESLDLYRLRR